MIRLRKRGYSEIRWKRSTWKKASKTLRRIFGRCELCGSTENLSVHHRGIAYAGGRPGNPHDKHDLRRENLQVLCHDCHWREDLPLWISYQRRERKRKRHAALNVGTGLVPVLPMQQAIIPYQYPFLIIEILEPVRVVDSYLIPTSEHMEVQHV